MHAYHEVAPDPTLQIARKGLEQLKGIPARCYHRSWWWFIYGCSEDHVAHVQTSEVQVRIIWLWTLWIFVEYTFPKMGEKAMLVAIPTSSGTGSEVTPFAIITDADTGTNGLSLTTNFCQIWQS